MKEDYLKQLTSIGTKHGIIKYYIQVGIIKDFDSFAIIVKEIHSGCTRLVNGWFFKYSLKGNCISVRTSSTIKKKEIYSEELSWETYINALWNEFYTSIEFKKDIEQLAFF